MTLFGAALLLVFLVAALVFRDRGKPEKSSQQHRLERHQRSMMKRSRR